jgi:cytidylate kinase
MQVIAIDGPAASGKSSVAKRIARDLGWLHVNTGNHYRTITWAVLDAGIDVRDTVAVAACAQSLPLTFAVEDGHVIIQVNGRTLTDEELTSAPVAGAVSLVAQVREVRERLVNEQRALAQRGPLVMEGRDIGSVVFPDTPNKFYIDARPEVRNARRRQQGLEDNLVARDKMDSERANAPLVEAGDAQRIDSSDLTIDEVVAQVKAVLKL